MPLPAPVTSATFPCSFNAAKCADGWRPPTRLISPGSGPPAQVHLGLQPVQLPPELRGPPVQPPQDGDGLGDDHRIGRVRRPAAVRFVPHDATLWSFARQTAILRSKR